MEVLLLLVLASAGLAGGRLRGYRGDSSAAIPHLSGETEDVAFEDSVIRSMLQIVDIKFNTLSTRIISLERGMNGMQYYISRQFNHVTKNLQAVNMVMNRLHAEVSHVDMETKATKAGVQSLSADFRNFLQNNIGVFKDMERNIGTASRKMQREMTELRRVSSKMQGEGHGASAFVPRGGSAKDPAGDCSLAAEKMEKSFQSSLAVLSNTTKSQMRHQFSQTSRQNELIEETLSRLDGLNEVMAKSRAHRSDSENSFKQMKDAVVRLAAGQNSLRANISSQNSENGWLLRGWNRSATLIDRIVRAVEEKLRLAEARDGATSLGNSRRLDAILRKLEYIENQSLAAGSGEATDWRESEVLQDIKNMTRRVFRLSEAIAGSTGWIPLITDKVLLLERLLNVSTNMSTGVLDRLSDQKISTTLNILLHGVGETKPSKGRGDARVTAERLLSMDGFRCARAVNVTQSTIRQIDSYLERLSGRFDRLFPWLTTLIDSQNPFMALVGGPTEKSGRVEIYHQGQWGTLCEPEFGHKEASDICRLLGYQGGFASAPGRFGPGTGVTWTVNLRCMQKTGSNCVHPRSSAKCDHSNDFGLVCDRNLVRLTESGIVQLYRNGVWGYVCSEGWQAEAGSVVCRQLGFATAEADAVVARPPGSFVWRPNTTCTGTESSLDACPHVAWGAEKCGTGEVARLVCRNT